MSSLGSVRRRAAGLLRWYPAEWRERYGAEFTELLIDDISERPRSLARTVDVIRGGLLVRAQVAGLAGWSVDSGRRLRAGLGVIACALAVFVLVGAAMWSQLTIGWQWSGPAVAGTRVAMFVMSAAALGFAALAFLAALPVVCALGRALVEGQSRRLVSWLALGLAGTAVVVLGSVHFGHRWPGTGGHRWADRDLVPAGVARFVWAATLWISSYWAHPRALSTFRTDEIAWMLLCPVALGASLTGAAGVTRRLALSQRVLRYETRLATVAALLMALFLAGAGSWVITGGPAPKGLFQVGAIDQAGLVVMTVALVLSFGFVQRSVGARPDLADTC